MSEQEMSVEELWPIFRDQKDRCAGCRTRLKWDQRGVRGRDGAWVVAQQEGDDEARPKCICFRCLDHEGPTLNFHLLMD